MRSSTLRIAAFLNPFFSFIYLVASDSFGRVFVLIYSLREVVVLRGYGYRSAYILIFHLVLFPRESWWPYYFTILLVSSYPRIIYLRLRRTAVSSACRAHTHTQPHHLVILWPTLTPPPLPIAAAASTLRMWRWSSNVIKEWCAPM